MIVAVAILICILAIANGDKGCKIKPFADLGDANLREADLCEADLREANLRWADLCEADLCGANLHGADLRGTDLYGADLRGADLRRTNLYGADLRRTNLREADLRGADLRRTSLRDTNLDGADLRGADLRGINLRRTNLTGTVLDPAAPVPELTDAEILEAGLEIRGDRVWGWRAAQSQHCGDTAYEVGQCYEAPVFSVDQQTVCHPGIYLAGREWLKSNYRPPFVRCYCLRSELVHAGSKWRCKRLWITG